MVYSDPPKANRPARRIDYGGGLILPHHLCTDPLIDKYVIHKTDDFGLNILISGRYMHALTRSVELASFKLDTGAGVATDQLLGDDVFVPLGQRANIG